MNRLTDIVCTGMPIVNIGKVMAMASSRERTPFGQRMLAARKAASLTQQQVREAIGIPQSTLSELETTAHSSGVTAQLAKLYGCDPVYLATGVDQPRAIAAGAANTEPGPDARGRVPLISWVQAGDWNGAHDPLHPGEADRWLECPASHSERTYALRVRGDSMTAPHGNTRSYPEGSIIFVDPARKSPVNGQRIIAKLDGSDEVTFKVFKQEDGRIWLQPLNPMHPPIFDQFKVLGTVIGKWEDE